MYMNIATSVGKVNIVAREVSQLKNILANNNILHNNNNTISEYFTVAGQLQNILVNNND